MKIDKNYKIKNLTPELSKRIQEICGREELIHTSLPHLFIDGGKVYWGGDDSYFENALDLYNHNPIEEITPQDFIAKFGEGENKAFRPEKEGKLRKLICDADNAMQNEGWCCAYDLANSILANCPEHMEDDAIKIKQLLRKKRYKEAHDIIHKMYDLTQPEEDRIRPTNS